MAANPALVCRCDEWVSRFDHWMNLQTPKASEQLSVVFDFRGVAGDAGRRGTARTRR
jgi:signal-transduction protein with cAMP-binding, CBS, and nucleotidyltransferase domain